MTNISNAADIIATAPALDCYVCGSKGIRLHTGLPDPQCIAPGQWNLKRCQNPDCGLVWLDPMPLKEDLWKAYRVYFTHLDYVPGDNRKVDWFNFLLLKIHKPIYKLFEHVVGMRKVEKKWRKKADFMFLGETSPNRGRLLDVGCGKGDLLVRFLQKGWNVEGQEVDAEAVTCARAKHNLNIHQGELENQRFPAESFDVITMNHVIEHVYDPLSLLHECLRILKPGGRIVLATPNIIPCLGYKKFGKYWAHLDPPRHLYLFTKENLKHCVTKAGFRSVNSFIVPGYAEGGAIRASIKREELDYGKKRWEFSKWLEASYLKVLAYYLFFLKKHEDIGEEIFLIATKDI